MKRCWISSLVAAATAASLPEGSSGCSAEPGRENGVLGHQNRRNCDRKDAFRAQFGALFRPCVEHEAVYDRLGTVAARSEPYFHPS